MSANHHMYVVTIQRVVIARSEEEANRIAHEQGVVEDVTCVHRLNTEGGCIKAFTPSGKELSEAIRGWMQGFPYYNDFHPAEHWDVNHFLSKEFEGLEP